MHAPLPLTQDLVLIGGGHAHALVLRRWGMAPLPGARLTLINPGPTAPYTGMLPGHVAGHYARTDLDIDLVRLARFAGARLILGTATGLDRQRRRVTVEGRGEIAYDVASIDVGIASDPPDLPGFAEHGVAAKPLGPYAARWAAFRDAVASGAAKPEVAVLGAGIGGVELALAMAHALRGHGSARRVTVIERAQALPGIGRGARAALMARMQALGIALVEATAPTQVTADAVRLADGRSIPAAFTVGVAGARPHGWLAQTDLPLRDGFVEIGPDLGVAGDPRLFAVGDCAHMTHAPRPKAGVYAVRQAPVLAENLRAALEGRATRRRYRPQRDYLKLVSLGEKAALADKFGLRLEGRLLWRWKDRIDRRFMARFTDLAPMPAPPPPRHAARGVAEALAGRQPMCGGCGAKVGGAALSAVLAGLPKATRPDVETGAGDDAAVLVMGSARQVISTDQLRGFTEDFGLMARFAAVHALGDVWAMGARPQAALANIVLPPMSETLQERTLAEIMAAAAQVFEAEGAAIVGGHSGLGAELSLGFTVTGLAEGAPVGLGGGRAGDALILTKPLGTGTVLAAEMALAAQGDWVAAALAAMSRTQGDWAEILAPAAHAMTDVTGFGLAGHLLEICTASGTGARLDLAALPLLPGAEALAARGIHSTLLPANRAATAGRADLPDAPRATLLFDPQTAGGLLAAVPTAKAETVMTSLAAAGCTPARIGQLTEGPAHLTVH